MEDAIVAAVTISNVPDELHRDPKVRVLPGTAFSDVSREMGLTNADVEALEQVLEQVRDRHPAEPMDMDGRQSLSD